MLRQASSVEFCVEGRPSCLAEDERLSPSHFDLCPTKFYPSSSAPQRPRQMCFAYLPPPAPMLKTPDCHQEPCQGPVGPTSHDKSTKKKTGTGKSGKRGRPTGTTKLAGYRTSTGRPLGTTKAAGFKTSPGRPLGTTKAAGYKVSPGRPPGSIKSQSRIAKLSYSACSSAAFPYSVMQKPACESGSLKEEESSAETPKMLLQAPPFLLSGFPIRNQKSPPPLSLMSADAFGPDVGQSRSALALPLHSPLPSYS